MRRFPRLALAAALLCAAPLTLAKDLTVSAAASLKEAFQEINTAYQKAHPDTQIRLNTAASGVLLQQLVQGAPVDVLATADQETMDKAAEAKVIAPATRRTFALNDLVLIQPKNAAFRVTRLQDLTNAKVQRIAVGNPASVPAGRYTKGALEKAGLWNAVSGKVISTQNVRQALDYVSRGEVDAGFVYRTDAMLIRDQVRIVRAVPLETPVSYAIAVTASSKDAAEAARYLNFIQSREGNRILQKYGFNPARR
ncbi:molybdate ABC transporter substrate-binding protein [Eikenella sp. S3360]|uniref:Molybdate ABC transporter substrate-binding protein n=1 Tax=Eikenella glucosivorans TaxID=2766967 RepID=A0ABS0N843_9NEIS|nr:molybdate ABC transporter substrate-binding protein [Eikenella glucosivorans]MBH5328473.1 molybdate ABC transporter substrate-binding protein [Eikenella glucosivorans]